MWHTNMQHMRGQCVALHFQDERSMVKVTQVVSSFGCVHSVSHPISRTKGQRSRSHGSFQVFRYNTWGDDVLCTIFRMKDQGHMGHSKFLPCPLYGFLLFWPNHFICGIHATHEGVMCRAPVIVICQLCGYMPIWLAFDSWGVPQLFRSLDLLVWHKWTCFRLNKFVLLPTNGLNRM